MKQGRVAAVVNKEDIKGQAKRLEDIFFEITEQPAQEFSGEGEV